MNIYIQLFIFLILPVSILLLGIVPLHLRGIVLALVLICTALLALYEKISLKSLGIRIDNIKSALLPYSIATLIGVIALLILVTILDKSPIANWWTKAHLQWAFLPISFAQEFVYRGVFQTKLQKLMHPLKAILIITILYSGMHILWKDPLILAMTFIGGLGWGYLWYKYPNLWLLTLSHAVLNFLAIYFNFFPWLVTEFYSLN